MRGYVPLPSYQVPRNAMLDFSPLNQGIDAISERRQNDQLTAERKEERQYQRGRNAMADQRYADERGAQDQQRRQYAGLLQDPNVTGAIPAPMLKIAEMAGPSGGPEFLAKYLDPAREADLAYKKALTEKAQREAAGGMNKYGKTGAVFQGPDGNFYTMQFAEDGTRKVEPVQYPGNNGTGPVPLTPARGVMEVGDTLVDKSTGGVVRNIGANIAESKRQEVVGRETGEGQIALPKSARALRSYEIKSGTVNSLIDNALQQAGPWTTGFVGSVASLVAGTPAHDLSKTLTGIQANLGFETLQDMRDNSPTGGALGQVSNIELELLQSAWGSVMLSQSEPQLRQNLERIKQIKAQFIDAKKRAYEDDVARFGAENVPNPGGAGVIAAEPADDGWANVGGVRIREKR